MIIERSFFLYLDELIFPLFLVAKPRICIGYIDPFFNSIANDSEEDYNDRNVTDSQEVSIELRLIFAILGTFRDIKLKYNYISSI